MRPALRIAVLATAVLAALALAPVQQALPAGPEGCVVTNPANPEFSNPCTYKATVKGGIAGAGTFKVIIKRGLKTIVYTNKQGNQWDYGVIKPRDTVTAKAISPGSSVAVGNPCPMSVSPVGC
jgi:hypothetical protein